MASDPDAPTRSLPGASPHDRAPADDEPAVLVPGERVGRYVIHRCIDRGGMGVVYEASDDALGRRVAVKVIRPDIHRDGTVAARLLREARAAAGLSHPNVVGVYEVGIHGASPFLAMEHVEGTTARQWLAAAPRRWRDVLHVFLQAAQGLAAAHAAGIIHRDVKPDNILVGDDRVRVADFGLARTAVEPAPPATPVAGDDDRLTATGAVMGTPRYMAPEQRAGANVDARSDQYSFCLSLYEALGGRLPLADGPLEMAAVPAWVRRALARGLSHEPAARFPSMGALVRALQRDPRARWVRAVALAAATVALAAGFAAWRASTGRPCQGAERKLAGVWDAAAKARIATAFGALGLGYAPSTWREVERILDPYAAAWVGMHREACEATRVHAEQSEDMLNRRMVCLEHRRQAFAVLVHSLAGADARIVENATRAAREVPAVADCGDLAYLASAAAPGANALETQANEDLALARMHRVAGKLREGRALAQRVVEAARAAGDRLREAEALHVQGQLALDDKDTGAAVEALSAAAELAGKVGAARVRIEAWISLSYVYVRLGRLDSARDVLDLALAAVRDAPDRATEGRLLHFRGLYLHRAGKWEDALRQFERSLAVQIELYGPDAEVLRLVYKSMANSLRRLGRFNDALAYAEKALAVTRSLGDDHPATANARVDLATVLGEMGRNDVAQEHLDRAAQDLRKAYGDVHEDVAGVESVIATNLARMARPADAIAHYRAALAIRDKLGERDVSNTLILRANLAYMLTDAGQAEEALAMLRDVLEIRERLFGPSHPDVAYTHRMIARAHLRLGHTEEAWKESELALALLTKAHQEEHVFAAHVLEDMAEVQRGRGNHRASLQLDSRAAAILEKTFPADHSFRVTSRIALAFDHLNLGAPLRALPLAEEAVALSEGRGDASRLARAKWALARALWEGGRDRARGLELARAARDGVDDTHEREKIDRWLAARSR